MSVGVYCGSFNPFHMGHLNILKKSLQIFDKVYVCRGVNPDKDDKLYKMPDLNWGDINCRTIEYDGLLTDFLNDLEEVNPTESFTLIRGLRSSADFESEKIQYRYLQSLKPDIKVVNIMCNARFEHISSSSIRMLQQYGKGGEYIV